MAEETRVIEQSNDGFASAESDSDTGPASASLGSARQTRRARYHDHDYKRSVVAGTHAKRGNWGREQHLDSDSSEDDEYGFDSSLASEHSDLVDFSAATERIDRVRQLLDEDAPEILEQLQVPEIVVVGVQSAGKSSVLKHIIGIDLFPASENTCTRMPIQVKMIPDNEALRPQIKVTDPLSGKHQDFSSIAAARKNILDAMNNFARTQGRHHRNHIESQHRMFIQCRLRGAPDITVTDLPGYVSVDPQNAQPGTCRKLKKSIRNAIKNPNTVIVAVVKASGDDLDTNIIWRLLLGKDGGQEVLSRTVAVLTHLDVATGALADDAVVERYLSNRGLRFSIGLGWVGLSHLDQEPGEAHRRASDLFFTSRDYHNSPRRVMLGIHPLRELVKGALEKRVKHSWPRIRDQVRERFQDTKDQLQALPIEIDGHLLENIATSFTLVLRQRLSIDLVENSDTPREVIDVAPDSDVDYQSDTDSIDSEESTTTVAEERGVSGLPLKSGDGGQGDHSRRDKKRATGPLKSQHRVLLFDVFGKEMEGIVEKNVNEQRERLQEYTTDEVVAYMQTTAGVVRNMGDLPIVRSVGSELADFLGRDPERFMCTIRDRIIYVARRINRLSVRLPSGERYAALRQSCMSMSRNCGNLADPNQTLIDLNQPEFHVVKDFLLEVVECTVEERMKQTRTVLQRQVEAFKDFPPTDDERYIGKGDDKNNKRLERAVNEGIKRMMVASSSAQTQRDMEPQTEDADSVQPATGGEQGDSEHLSGLGKLVLEETKAAFGYGLIEEDEFQRRQGLIFEFGRALQREDEMKANMGYLWNLCMTWRKHASESKNPPEAFLEMTCSVKVDPGKFTPGRVAQGLHKYYERELRLSTTAGGTLEVFRGNEMHTGGVPICSIPLANKGVKLTRDYKNFDTRGNTKAASQKAFKIILNCPGKIPVSFRPGGGYDVFQCEQLYQAIQFAMDGFRSKDPSLLISRPAASAQTADGAGKRFHTKSSGRQDDVQAETFRQKWLSLWQISNELFFRNVPRTIYYEFPLDFARKSLQLEFSQRTIGHHQRVHEFQQTKRLFDDVIKDLQRQDAQRSELTRIHECLESAVEEFDIIDRQDAREARTTRRASA